MGKIGYRFLWVIWLVYFIALLLLGLTLTESRKLTKAHDSHVHHHNSQTGGTKKHSHHQPKHSESQEEEDTTASPPQVIGIKGMASAGVIHLRNSQSQSIPKCLGQDMRMEKIIQVTQFCEGDTGEGKNETQGVGRSLCFTACMYKYLGLIGDDLMFTSNIDSVVVDVFPPIAHSLVKKAMRSCAKQAILPLSKSDNCTSFGFVKGCILRNVNNICSGDY